MFFTRIVQQLLLRHSEQRERARQLLEQAKKDGQGLSSPTKVSLLLFASSKARYHSNKIMVNLIFGFSHYL